MSKEWFKITFKQIQPIHIGSGNWGVVNETRVFIPGITMWGALTNAYFKLENKHDEKLFEEITCFYPKIDDKVLYPNYKDGEFYLGYISENEFRHRFVKSYTSTAINPKTLNAKDESLHEIDLIYPEDNNGEKLEWIGYVKCEEEYLDKIKEIYIGGDIRYGFGLMKLDKFEKDNYTYNVIKGIYKENSENNENPLKNFLEFNNQKFEGEIEILAEFDFENKTTPMIKYAKYYITPGSKLKE